MEKFEPEIDKKREYYVLCKKTLAELESEIGDNPRYDRTILYEHDINIGKLSKKQEELQRQNRWYTEKNLEMRIYDDTIMSLIEDMMYEEIFSGCRENLGKKVYEKIMNTEIIAAGFLDKPNGSDYESFNLEIHLGKKDDKHCEYSNDLGELHKKLKDVRHNVTFGEDKKYVKLERVTVSAYPYAFHKISDLVSKKIDKFIGTKLTYCIKSDKIIVPEEYIEKGKDGIDEWREIKKTGNKNNSMEKRMLRQIVAKKRRYAFSAMSQIMHKIATSNHRWDIPTLEVDGRWNQQKTQKLAHAVLKAKTAQQYIDIDDEKIVKEFKEYWKKILMDAYNAVDKMEIEE